MRRDKKNHEGESQGLRAGKKRHFPDPTTVTPSHDRGQVHAQQNHTQKQKRDRLPVLPRQLQLSGDQQQKSDEQGSPQFKNSQKLVCRKFKFFPGKSTKTPDGLFGLLSEVLDLRSAENQAPNHDPDRNSASGNFSAKKQLALAKKVASLWTTLKFTP